jgi:hypothetical protein
VYVIGTSVVVMGGAQVGYPPPPVFPQPDRNTPTPTQMNAVSMATGQNKFRVSVSDFEISTLLYMLRRDTSLHDINECGVSRKKYCTTQPGGSLYEWQTYCVYI